MKRLKSLFGILLIAPLLGTAQEQRSLTLEQALTQTLTENKQIEIDRLAEQTELFKRKAAKGLRSPQFNFTATYTHMSDDIVLDFNHFKPAVTNFIGMLPPILPPAVGQKLFGADWRYVVQDKDFAILGASVTLPIFTGGKINAANRAAKLNMNLAREEGEQHKSALNSELVERYYGVSLAMQALDVRKEVLVGMEQHLTDAERLEKNGIIPKVERLYAQMVAAEAKTEVEKARATLKTVTTALKNTLNRSNDPASIIPVTSMFVLTEIEGIDYFNSMAQQNNSILKQIALKKSLAKEAVKVERSAFMPQIAAMGGVDIYNYQLASFAPRWTVGAGLKFTLFDGLHRENSFRAAKSRVQQVEVIEENAADDIRTLIEKCYNELKSTKDVYDTFASSIEFAQEYLRVKEVAFKNGMATSKEVTDARLLLSKTKIERLQTAFNYDKALSSLLENCGINDLFIEYQNSTNNIPVYYNANEK